MHKSCWFFSIFAVCENLILHGLEDQSGAVQFVGNSAVQLNFDLIHFARKVVFCCLFFS